MQSASDCLRRLISPVTGQANLIREKARPRAEPLTTSCPSAPHSHLLGLSWRNCGRQRDTHPRPAEPSFSLSPAALFYRFISPFPRSRARRFNPLVFPCRSSTLDNVVNLFRPIPRSFCAPAVYARCQNPLVRRQFYVSAARNKSLGPLHNTRLATSTATPPHPMIRNEGLEDGLRLPETETSHPANPIPEEPAANPEVQVTPSTVNEALSLLSLDTSTPSDSPSDSDGPSTPSTDPQVDLTIEKLISEPTAGINFTGTQKAQSLLKTVAQSRRGSAKRVVATPSQSGVTDNACCGGGCCFLKLEPDHSEQWGKSLKIPDNDAFRNLSLTLGGLSLTSTLTNVISVPDETIALSRLTSTERLPIKSTGTHPPSFLTPHPPHEVFSARIHHARELTKPGAEKRTFHFELDVTDYPEEDGNVDFVVGGAIGVCPANSPALVDDLLRLLSIPTTVWDRPVQLKTTGGRWPTIWGDDTARHLVTTRRELLTWCSDLQSRPPTKGLLRLLAEYAGDESEKKILMYLSSAQGQAAFCELRTGPHVTVNQLLHAFPSSKPPLSHLLSTLQQLMPRFYSLSNDPHRSCIKGGETDRRLVEFAVTMHEMPNWKDKVRTGVGSGFLARTADEVIASEKAGLAPDQFDIRVPMFRGLMSNPLAREFASDGPMLLIGAGVGVAPFRGFVQRRLKNANCANKVWVLQGVRDSLLDELYSGEWGVHEQEVKRVVQSRRGEGRYVQEEVRNQADLVWYVINSVDGRIFVCGSTKGMGEGVESALVDVAATKGRLNRHEAEDFWKQKKECGQYVSETW